MVVPSSLTSDEHRRRRFVLQVVQPGLVGMMDGSVSTLAPIFATAFATQNTHTAFIVGLAASVGAGISMAFAEALSDDGELTGRGNPWVRGGITGAMTVVGGLGHTLPFLIPHFHVALGVAYAVVAVELAFISWIRFHFLGMNIPRSILQVMGGGILVFLVGILLGMA